MIFDMTKHMGEVETGTFIEAGNADWCGTKIISLSKSANCFACVAESDVTGASGRLYSMVAFGDGQYYGARTGSSGYAVLNSSNATISFSSSTITVAFPQNVAMLKNGATYRWFAWNATTTS